MAKTTVLIVEDEAIVAMDLAGKLARLGYEVAGIAATGAEAVDLAIALRPRIVLMDIQLRGAMDGIKAAEAIRGRIDVPVIFLTAHSDAATLSRAKLSEPFGYVLKPFEDRELTTAVEIALYKHQADRQLREQREWLRVTLSSIGDAVITCDTDGCVTFLNPVAEALTGWCLDDSRGRPIAEVIPLVDERTHEPLEKITSLVLEEGKPVVLANHTALVTRDGREIPVEDSAAPILAADGGVIGIVVVFHDVTEKRRVQEELRRSHDELERRVEERTGELFRATEAVRSERQRLYDVLETLPVYVVLLSADYYVPFANRFFRERFGDSRGRRCYEYLFNREEPCEICESFSVFRTGAPHHWYWTGPDGRDYDIHDYPFTDADGSKLVLEMGIDITERKRAEARILLQNSVFNAINRIFLQVLGNDTEEALCKGCLETAEKLTGSRFGIIAELNGNGLLDTIALTDPGWNACRMQKTDALPLLKDVKLDGIFGSVVRFGRPVVLNDPASSPQWSGLPDGHPAVDCFLGVPLKQQGKTIGLIGLANRTGGYSAAELEVAETLAMAIVEALMRKRAELSNQELNRDLEKRVAERTAELDAAVKELEAFTYTASHDLRAPLRSINGFSRVLMDDYCDKLDAAGRDSLERIIAATRRMGELIDDLLNLSSLTRAEMRWERVDLGVMAGRIAGRLRETNPERRVDFVIADSLYAEGDGQLLAVLLENLMDNAWKFTGEVSPAVIEIGETRQDGIPAFFVRDNGIGFDMAFVDKLFNPFQRLHRADQFPGTGIGLATVKRIVNRHGGQVWARGELGKGATFYFTLGT